MRVKKKGGEGVIVPNLLNEVDLVCVHDVHVFCGCICVCYILY